MINIAICDDEVYMLNLLTEKVLGFQTGKYGNRCFPVSKWQGIIGL